MAYQQVGTPRFYVSILQWLKSLGKLTSSDNTPTLDSLIEINPSSRRIFTGSGSGVRIDFVCEHNFINLMPSNKNFAMWLGHNLASAGMSATLEVDANTPLANNNLINSDQDNDGFSISIGNNANDAISESIAILFATKDGSSQNYQFELGSFLYGTYYEMPHSPDLNLSLSYDYSGIKEITTRGGASLSNSFYSKPPNWGELGAWELKPAGTNYPNLSRSGRRIWDLSFSYLDDGDVFGSNSAYGKLDLGSVWDLQQTEEDRYDTDDVADGKHTYNLLDDDNFYSQVIHKTNGGQLPFIFQPNKDDNTNFAIAKIDSDFTFEQVANGVYNVKMKIREVW